MSTVEAPAAWQEPPSRTRSTRPSIEPNTSMPLRQVGWPEILAEVAMSGWSTCAMSALATPERDLRDRRTQPRKSALDAGFPDRCLTGWSPRAPSTGQEAYPTLLYRPRNINRHLISSERRAQLDALHHCLHLRHHLARDTNALGAG